MIDFDQLASEQMSADGGAKIAETTLEEIRKQAEARRAINTQQAKRPNTKGPLALYKINPNMKSFTAVLS